MKRDSLDPFFLAIASSGYDAIRRMKHAKAIRVSFDRALRQQARQDPGASLSGLLELRALIEETKSKRDRMRTLEDRAVLDFYQATRDISLVTKLGAP
jgi:hypothetical protein